MIDHIVYATADLEGTVAALAERTGVTADAGGRHVGHGTRNHLADLGGGAYLEIIGPDPDQAHPDHPRPFGVDEAVHPILVAWAIRVTDMDAAVAAAAATGWDPGTAVSMSRARPDGVVLQWRLTPWEPPHPFLIEWGSTPHPCATAATGLELVTLRVPELPTSVTSDARLEPGSHLAAVIDTPNGRITL